MSVISDVKILWDIISTGIMSKKKRQDVTGASNGLANIVEISSPDLAMKIAQQVFLHDKHAVVHYLAKSGLLVKCSKLDSSARGREKDVFLTEVRSLFSVTRETLGLFSYRGHPLRQHLDDRIPLEEQRFRDFFHQPAQDLFDELSRRGKSHEDRIQRSLRVVDAAYAGSSSMLNAWLVGLKRTDDSTTKVQAVDD